MAKKIDFDVSLFNRIDDRAMELKRDFKDLHDLQDDMYKHWLMRWDDEDKTKNKQMGTKITLSPDNRNVLQGAIRLLTAADPAFSLAKDKNTEEVMQVSSKLEKAASQMWQAGGRARGNPIHYDAVQSMMIFGEVHISITKTEDLVEHAKGGTPAAIANAEDLADQTPYLFDVWDPRSDYPERDSSRGLTAFYREVETTAGRVFDEFGGLGRQALGTIGDIGRFDRVTTCHWWDYQYQLKWIKGENVIPLIQEEHGLPFIPIVAHIGEGSLMFAKPEDQVQPFLFTVAKSGLWERQNLALTVLFSTIFAMGDKPLFVYERNEPEKTISLDFDTGIVNIDRGESLTTLDKKVIDPGLLTSIDIADRKTSESTIYSQTLGQPLGTDTFSTVALLHQAGRLPLIIAQRKSGWAIGDAIKKALRWMKLEGVPGTYDSIFGDLAAAEIPDKFELEAYLDIALPQDKLQNSNIARIISEGERPLASQRYAREEHLGIEQPEVMVNEIWGEQAAQLHFEKYMVDQMAQLKAQMEALMTPPMPPPPPGPPGPGQGPPPGAAPVETPPFVGPAGQPGPPTEPRPIQPTGQPVPSEVMTGGGQPPIRPPYEGI